MSKDSKLPLLPLETTELTGTQQVRLELLAKTHVGQQIMTDFVFSASVADLQLAQLEKLTQWVLGQTQDLPTTQLN